MYKNLTVSENGEGIVTVTINRPKSLNSINVPTLKELDQVFRVDLDRKLNSVRVVILTGSGEKSFSSGLDLTCPSVRAIFVPEEISSAGIRATFLKRAINELQSPIMAISEFPRPVICAINGLCIGLGMDIATACDIRVCAEGATFSVREVKIGICADLGSLYFFPRVCRNDSWVREVCFTGRIFSATEARENGLVSAVIPGISLLKQAEKIAKSIEDNEPVAVEGTKINLNKGSRGTLRESMEFVSQWNSVRLQETDIIGRAISKFMEDRGKSRL